MANIRTIIALMILICAEANGQGLTQSELSFANAFSISNSSACYLSNSPPFTNVYVNPYNGVQLYWGYPTGSPPIYEIVYRSTTNGVLGVPVAGPSTNLNAWIDTPPNGGTTYYYTLQVSNSCYVNNSPQTNATTFPYPFAQYIPSTNSAFSDYGTTPAVNGGPVNQLNDLYGGHNLTFTNTYSAPPTYAVGAVNGQNAVSFTTGDALLTQIPTNSWPLPMPYMFVMVISVTNTITPSGAASMPIFDNASIISAGYSDVSNALDWGIESGTSHIQGGSISNGVYLFVGNCDTTSSYIRVNGSPVVSGSLDNHAMNGLVLVSDDLTATIQIPYLAIFTNMPPSLVSYYEGQLMHYYSIP